MLSFLQGLKLAFVFSIRVTSQVRYKMGKNLAGTIFSEMAENQKSKRDGIFENPACEVVYHQ